MATTDLPPGSTILIKYGGSAMDDPAARAAVAAEVVGFARSGLRPVVVHGGGKAISRWLARLGETPRFVDGLRVTDAATMEVTEMVLSGTVNADVVGEIGRAGGRAVGLSGKDCGLFVARRLRDDLGLVGEVESVDPAVLHLLTGAGIIPVVSPVGSSTDGVTLNCNADTVAAAIAAAFGVAALLYLTDVDGVMRGGAVIGDLSAAEAERLLTDPAVTGGMIPKVRCALDALHAGVSTVKIVNGSTPGTLPAALRGESGTTFHL
jgi:acetylglutamate kinase